MSVQPYTVDDAADDIAQMRGELTAKEEQQTVSTINVGAVTIDASSGPLGTGDVTGPETGWTTIGSMASGWSKTSGIFSYRMFPGGLVAIKCQNIVPDGTNVADGTTIVTTANGLPAAYRPANVQRLVGWGDAGKSNGSFFESCGFQFQTDGSVQCFGFSTAARRADVYGFIYTS